jgi:acyl-CoA thioesterase II
MPSTVADLLAILALETIDDGIYRGVAPETTLQRVFGGQVLAQALMAAGATVSSDRHPHSLHGYFLRPGDPSTPIVYVVENTRDGRSFSTRRAIARQHGRPIFHMTASFQASEEGLEHQDAMPVVPDPHGLQTFQERLAGREAAARLSPDEWAALEVRFVPPDTEAGGLQVWLRTTGPLPDDDLIHAATLAYASDMTLLSTAAVPHQLQIHESQVVSASIDHAMWFHRRVRVDHWLLHDQESPSASGGRGLGRGRVFDLAGQLVATTVQEGLLRVRS